MQMCMACATLSIIDMIARRKPASKGRMMRLHDSLSCVYDANDKDALMHLLRISLADPCWMCGDKWINDQIDQDLKNQGLCDFVEGGCFLAENPRCSIFSVVPQF